MPLPKKKVLTLKIQLPATRTGEAIEQSKRVIAAVDDLQIGRPDLIGQAKITGLSIS